MGGLRPLVVGLVAARDEASSVADTVGGLLAASVREVIVVDDGSSDETASRAAGAGATVWRTGRRLGKGGALGFGLERMAAPDVVVLADADLGSSARALAPLIEEIVSGRADICIAVLPPQGGGFGSVKRFSAWAISTLVGFRPLEPLSGQRVLTWEALNACRPLAKGFGVETAMTIDALRLGLIVKEMDADIRHRATGRDLSGFVHRGRQGFDILGAVAARAVRLR